MKKVVGLVMGLVPVSAFAECVPVPDCASIGYTETSCDGDSLKCPFDVSKLKCIPCDSSFRYSCDGANVKNPVGVACNNKYVACECIDDTTFMNGECICDTSCKVGAIYYSDGTCSSCIDENKNIIGVVVKDNELITAVEFQVMYWSPDNANIAGIENIPESKSRNLMNGMDNTQAIVNHYGVDGDSSTVAGLYCYNYYPNGWEISKGKWYLPAAGELDSYLTLNYSVLNKRMEKFGFHLYRYFYSSSEIGSSASCGVHPGVGNINWMNKTSNQLPVLCFYSIANDC